MLFGIFAVFLAVGTPLPKEQLAEVREILNRQLEEIDTVLTMLEHDIASGTLIDTTVPQPGIVLNSEDEVDTSNGFHPVRVIAVYTGGPADRAGIRPGDRMLAIGPRHLEHETTKVVYLLLTQAKSPVVLTIQHPDGTPEVLSVELKPLKCVGSAVRAMDKARILRKAKDLHEISRNARTMIK